MIPRPLAALGLVPLLASAPGCRAPATHAPAEAAVAAGPERALDWTLGEWTGVRRDAAEGDEAPMVMRVASILGGAGQTRELEIVHDGGTYRGFCVQVYDPQRELWVRRYVNDVRRTYAHLEGTALGERSVWRGTSPTRTRESQVVSERTPEGGWRRTMSISEDGGATWSPLWIDELTRR